MEFAIVDDIPGDGAVLAGIITKWLRDNGIEGKVVLFEDGEEFLNAYKPAKFKVVFLDILLGKEKEDGITLARHIRSRAWGGMAEEEQVIVFVTIEKSFALDGYSVSAFDYLVKPVEPQKVDSVMKRALKIGVCRRYVSIKEKRETKQIPAERILYIATANRAVEVHTIEGVFKTYIKFEEISEQLKGDSRFVCSCRGILVNLAQVKGFELQDFKLYNGERIPISRLKRAEMNKVYTNYLFARVREG